MSYYDPFKDVADELVAMHDKKGADYGRTSDPYANVRGSQDFGVPPWVGAMVRANDKVRRLQKAASGGTLANEGVEDSLIDLAVYAIIALILWREDPTVAKAKLDAKVKVALDAYGERFTEEMLGNRRSMPVVPQPRPFGSVWGGSEVQTTGTPAHGDLAPDAVYVDDRYGQEARKADKEQAFDAAAGRAFEGSSDPRDFAGDMRKE